MLGTTANIAAQALIGTNANITAQALIGTSANITAQALLGTSANVTAQGLIGTSANIAAQALIGTTANINAQALIGTSANIAIQALLGTSANVAAMALLGTTQNVANQALLGTSQNVTNMNTLAPISGDITTTAGVSTSVTAYAKQYSSGSGDISTRGDGTGTVTEGDIRFRTDTDTMRVYTGSTWQDVAVTAGSFLQVTNNLSDLNNATTARTNLGLDALLAAKAPLASPNFSGAPQISGTNIPVVTGHIANLSAGANGSLPYQTGSNATTFLSIGSTDQVLKVAGGVPVWADAAGGSTLEATASGSIANGKPVVVNTDGTVSAVAETSVATAVGTPAVFESANTTDLGAAFDSNSNKVVIAYRDNGNSNYGTAIVGTVDPSDNSITFGTPVVFESATTRRNSVVFDSSNNKVVIAYSDNGNDDYGTAIVGTVSGTSISFGTAVVFETANSSYIATTFDSSNNKVIIAYKDHGNSFYGTAIVGTVSGTSISFGTAVVFESAQTEDISATFDSNSNKVVIAYRDDTNSGYGTAIVGTVSGTSISFGTPVVFESASTQQIKVTFDSNSNKVVITYGDAGNSVYGTAIVGTVSNTSISFGTPVVFESAATQYPSPTFDSNSNKVVIAYQDNTNSSYGTAVVFQVGFTSTNLTSENYIGIATSGPYTNSQTATIDLVGAVNEDQSSLTAGQQYFVQTDGTLGLSADSPSVTAGTAVAATKIIVKG